MRPNKRLLLSRAQEGRTRTLALRLAPNGDPVAAQQNREAVREQRGFVRGRSGFASRLGESQGLVQSTSTSISADTEEKPRSVNGTPGAPTGMPGPQ